MPTPSTNLGLSSVQTEFTGANPVNLSEYYKGGSYVSNFVVGPPTSGQFPMSTLRNKTRVSISNSVSSVNEGDSVTFTVTAPTINGTTIYWAAVSSTGAQAVDIVGDSPLGSVTISSNTATISLTAKLDADTPETGESFAIRLYYTQADRDAFTNEFAQSNTVSINNATYTATPAANNVNEGGSVTINVATTNVSNSITLYWSINHSTTSSGDFSTNSGSFTITNNAGSFTVGPLADQVTEGAESFTVSIRADSTSGTVLATTSSITVNDTSTTPVPTYSASPANSSVNEGSSVTINVTTSNVANGTTLYWTNNHITTSSADFGTNAGSFTINNNAGSFTVSPTADNTTEGAETFSVQIRTGSLIGSIVATTTTITVNDTSQTPFYTLTRSVASVNEGGSFTITFTTNQSGSFAYTISGVSSADIGGASLTDTFTYSGETRTYNVTADSTTEGTETFTMSLNNGQASSSVTINDTSQTAFYTLTRSVASVNEGGSFSITFSTNQSGSFGYTISGVSSADIGGASLTGTFTYDGESRTYNVTADSTTEGTETFTMSLNNGQASSSVSINDTSQTPASYTLSPSVSSVNEGGSFTITFTTNQSGSFAYTISGVSSADIGGASLTGTFTYSGETRTYSVTADSTTEGTETFTMSLNNGLASTSVTINDTSTTPVTFDLTSVSVSNNNTATAGDSWTLTVNANTTRSVDTKITITINQVYFRGNTNTDWVTGNQTYADIITIPANQTSGTFTGRLGPEQGSRTGLITASAGTGAPSLTSRSVTATFATNTSQITGVVVGVPSVTVVPTSSGVSGIINNNICWFSFIATSSTMTIDTNASTNISGLASPDTKIALYKIEGGLCIGVNDDLDVSVTNYRSAIVATGLTAGSTYWVAVAHYAGWYPSANSTTYWSTAGSASIALSSIQQIKLSIKTGSLISSPQ